MTLDAALEVAAMSTWVPVVVLVAAFAVVGCVERTDLAARGGRLREAMSPRASAIAEAKQNMTNQDAIRSAHKAANAVYGRGSWTMALGNLPGEVLARFVSQNRDAPAEALYRFAVARDIGARPWSMAPQNLRVACEIFRATYLVLLRLVAEAEENAKAAARVRRRVPPAFAERETDRVDGTRDRVMLRRPR